MPARRPPARARRRAARPRTRRTRPTRRRRAPCARADRPAGRSSRACGSTRRGPASRSRARGRSSGTTRGGRRRRAARRARGRTWRAAARLASVSVGPGDVHSAFAQAAAEDGIVLSRQSFDWLCEQGHVGLERVAKARRDPAIVEPVKAALEQLAAIYARLKGDVVGPARVAREPAAAGRPRARTDRHGDRGRRLAALHLVPPHRARALPRRRDRRASTSASTWSCAARWCSRTDGLDRALAAKGFGFGGRAAGAGLPRRAARPRDAGDGPSAAGPDRGRGRRRRGRLPPPPRGSLLALSAAS